MAKADQGPLFPFVIVRYTEGGEEKWEVQGPHGNEKGFPTYDTAEHYAKRQKVNHGY